MTIQPNLKSLAGRLLRNLIGEICWVTGDGTRVKLKDMETGHLINCFTYVTKKLETMAESGVPKTLIENYKYQGYTYSEWRDIFEIVLERRAAANIENNPEADYWDDITETMSVEEIPKLFR
jgi:hypothetical protein